MAVKSDAANAAPSEEVNRKRIEFLRTDWQLMPSICETLAEGCEEVFKHLQDGIDDEEYMTFVNSVREVLTSEIHGRYLLVTYAKERGGAEDADFRFEDDLEEVLLEMQEHFFENGKDQRSLEAKIVDLDEGKEIDYSIVRRIELRGVP